MPAQPITAKNFLRGLVPTAGILSQPKGSVARGSNLLLTRRGSLRTADGSQLVHAFNGTLTVLGGLIGKCMAAFLFSPIGVPRYYLALYKTASAGFNNGNFLLGAPQNLVAADGGAGGSLPINTTVRYRVTALDGNGGETGPSNIASFAEPGASHKVTLTWNVVPNAAGYNVYSDHGAGSIALLYGTGLPVAQVPAGTLSVTFTDDGSPVSTFVSTLATATLNSPTSVAFVVAAGSRMPVLLPSGVVGITVAGTTVAAFNQNYQVTGLTGVNSFLAAPTTPINSSPPGTVATGGTMTENQTLTPVGDSTNQTLLVQMPAISGIPSALPVSYGYANVVALFPADPQFLDGGGGGGPGGGGGGGGGGSGGGGGGGSVSTPAGGIPGNVSVIPQFVQFTNQAVIALGNGFAPQVFSDPTGTLVNPATAAVISAISVDAFGVVTVTTATPHGIQTGQVGGNVVIAGVTNSLYNYVGPTIQIVSTTQYKVRNLAAIGQGASSGGTSTTTALPIFSNFVPSIPAWSATTAYGVGSVIAPTAGNAGNHIYKVIQAGTSGSVQPAAWPQGTGGQQSDGTIIWREAGLLNSTAPPPPGAAHLAVYSGVLWAFNTSPTNTATGLDGPTAVRASDVNNLNSWNPINQAFLDKDDGFEGMGLANFTITAQGIPPQGSLVAFKNQGTYQLFGLFGAPNFQIQRVKTDMGTTAPRTIQFVPGYGIVRWAHLGFAVFDSVNDRVISEELRPYLFPSNDGDVADITVMDATNAALSWSALTAAPPMYVTAIPIGNSGGALTRLLCYDLVLKAWCPAIDLPFSVSTLAQFRTVIANPVTVMGGFSDGALSRWQASDVKWDTGATGARSPSVVAWSVRTPTVASNEAAQVLFLNRLTIRGINTNSVAPLTVTVRLDGKAAFTYKSPALPVGTADFVVEVGIVQNALRAEADISGTGDVELLGFEWDAVPKPAGVPLLVT